MKKTYLFSTDAEGIAVVASSLSEAVSVLDDSTLDKVLQVQLLKATTYVAGFKD